MSTATAIILILIFSAIAFIVGYFVGSNNPYPTAKKKLLSKWGITKMIPFVAIAVLFASCGKYNDTIQSTYTGTGNSCYFRPLDSAIMDSAAKGWISLTATDGNSEICPVFVKVESSWPQKWAIARHNHTSWVAFLLWGIGVVCAVVGVVMGNKGKGPVAVVTPFVVAIALACFGAEAINWAATKEFEMSKVIYDNPDARHAFMDANLFK